MQQSNRSKRVREEDLVMPISKKPFPSKAFAGELLGSPLLAVANIRPSPTVSDDSDLAHSSSKTIDLLLVSAKYSHRGVTFEVEKDTRPDTNISGASGSVQGDHVTAYISFLEFLLNITDNRPLREISDHLIDVAKSILASSDQHKVFDDLKKEFDLEISDYCPREQRKRLTATLRAENAGQTAQKQEEINRLKMSLKLAENTLIGQFIQNLGRAFLREVNLADNIAFAKQGKIDRQEGSRVKQATYALRLINELQQIEELKKSALSYTTDALQQRLLNVQNNLIKRVRKPNSELKQGLRRILEKEPELIAKKNEIEKSKRSDEATRSLRRKIKSEVRRGKTLSGTVDEEVRRRASDQVKQAFNKLLDAEVSKITDADSDKALLFSLMQEAKSDLPRVIGGKIGNLFDFKHFSERVELLPAVAARHLVILFHAFPNLQKFNNEIRSAIIESFVEESILKANGWQGKTTRLGVPITRDYIISKINEQADLSDGRCRMKANLETTTVSQSQSK